MHPFLAISNPGMHVRWQLQKMLSAGPWCWPLEDGPLANAASIVGSDVPLMASGVVPLVAVNDYCASLWVMLPELDWDNRDLSLAELGKTATFAWQTAAAALPRSVRVLWKSVSDSAAKKTVARHMVALPLEGREVRFDAKLEGTSFGLSFLLAQASSSLDTPLPGDLIASATISARGSLGPVDGLEAKLAVVLERAPRIRRFMVASEQVEEAEAYAAGRLEIVGVSTAVEAIEHVFPDLATVLSTKGKSPAARRSFVDSVFSLALGAQGATHDWKPVAEAARLALAGWENVSDDEYHRLTLARAIAERHAGNRGRVELPSSDWLASFPLPLRISIVTHVVQQVADTGSPSPAAVMALAEQYQTRGSEAFEDHIKLLGAVARLEAVSGDPAVALAYQSECSSQWMRRFQFQAVSFSLSEQFRLAGCLNDAGELDKANALYDELVSRGELSGLPRAYVDLSRCRAMVMNGSSDRVIDRLQGLFDDEHSPVQLQLSAARWLSQAHRTMENQTLADNVRDTLVGLKDTALQDVEVVTKYLTLVRLDAALSAKEQAEAASAVVELEKVETYPTRHLVDSFSIDLAASVEAYVQRYYPY